MVPRHRRADPKEVIGQGRLTKTKLTYWHTLEDHEGRYAVVVSKKVAKLATSRHLIKRWYQSAMSKSGIKKRALVASIKKAPSTYGEVLEEVAELRGKL